VIPPVLGCGVLDFDRGALLVVDDADESPVVPPELGKLPPAEIDRNGTLPFDTFPFEKGMGLLCFNN